MNADINRLLGMAKAAGVRVSLEGDVVKLRGPLAAIATLRPALVPFKSAIVAHLRAAANDADDGTAGDYVGVQDHGGELFLPWGPTLTVDDVRRLRAELAAMIGELATLEGWPRSLLDEIMVRATVGPLSDLLPNHGYFTARLAAAHDEVKARAVLAARAWEYDPRLR